MAAFRPLSQGAANIVSMATVFAGAMMPMGGLLLLKSQSWAARTAAADPTVMLWNAADTPWLFVPVIVALICAVLFNRLLQDGRLGAWALSFPIDQPWRLIRWIAVAFFVLTAACLFLALRFGHVIRSDGIVFSGALPGAAMRTVPLSHVREVQTGCATVPRRRGSPTQLPIYRMILPDGTRLQLERSRFDMGYAAWLKGLASVDREVRSLRIPRRVSRDDDGRPERSVECIASFDRNHTPEQSADFHLALDLLDLWPSS